ncbi:MAG: NAD-dependent DNA ligase LigA [Bacilli bacterium]|nr:NAD-dependent DNA ligase LigA [Bacilli bacterium]
MDDKVKRMKELIETLNYASKMYYQFSDPIMTDYEYDKLYDELVKLEKETNTVFSNSPTVNVETEVSKQLEKVEHSSPMLSLAKTKSIDELSEFIGDKEGLLSWKLDGLTIVLTYKEGKLVRGVTRGNGIIGEVVTENVKKFKNIPFTIPYTGELVVRGEAIIKYSDFNKMNDEDNEDDMQYKNPRNLCSGSVRQLDSRVTAERNVNCIVFALISSSDKMPNSKEEQFEWLESLGFECVERVKVNKDNMRDMVLMYKDKIKDYDIPSDGLVLTFDDMAYGLSLGMTAKYPRHSIAFKWKDETVESKLLSVDWSASRTGLINPVAVFEPIEIEGTIVSRASVHNLSIMSRLKLGIGDTIEVFKANMIIPQIANDIEKTDNVEIPKYCPVCNHETSIVENNGVKYLYCLNDFCHAKFIKKLDLFTSRNAMNIDGISEQILAVLFKEGMLEDYSDIYHLDRHKDKIINYEGFGTKSYENMIYSIEKSRKVKIANFIYALGIPEIGLSRAKLICKHCGNDINKVRNITFEELSNIDGVGDIIATTWCETFKNSDFNNSVDKLLKEVTFTDVSNTNNKLEDMVFVITGSLNHFENRDSMIEYIESLGGRVISSISNKVNYLINNDVNSTSTKNQKAKELGVKIISEEEFISMCK